MAAALKDQYGPEIAREIARQIAGVWPAFDKRAFLRDALLGYEPLSLTQRARHIAKALKTHLPADIPRAIGILVESASRPHGHKARHGMTSFLYMPHLNFIAEHGLDHFEESMAAQHRLTQLFTAEFSIRAFLEKHPERTLARLAQWAADPSPHVRRLVSEGTRPRLPWAPRLRAFLKDPAPVLALLEQLKDDSELYVRRSVANNLNDIGKDHPGVLTRTARRWLRGATAERNWIVRHALRSAVKRADPAALTALGYGHRPAVRVIRAKIAPRRVRIGDSVRIDCTLAGESRQPASLLVDLVVHYARAGGRSSPKVFKWKQLQLARSQQLSLSRRLSLRQLSTRRHHPGRHRVELQVNGRTFELGTFEVVARDSGAGLA